MTPYYTPQDTDYGAPKVFLAAIGAKMTEVAAEVADGVIAHPFTTTAYLRETTLPALERGFAKAGKSHSDFEVSSSTFIITGETEEQMQKAEVNVRQQIAVCAAVPTYKPALDSIGAGELETLSQQGRMQEMGDLITPNLLKKFAVIGEPDSIGEKIKAHYGDLVDRTSAAAYARIPKAARSSIVQSVHSN